MHLALSIRPAIHLARIRWHRDLNVYFLYMNTRYVLTKYDNSRNVNIGDIQSDNTCIYDIYTCVVKHMYI